MITLRLFEKKGFAPKVIHVEHFPVSLGRSKKNAIECDHPLVSNEHLEIRQTEIGYEIEDLRSANGTFHKGERKNLIEFQSDTEVTLANEIRVEILIHTDEVEKTKEIYLEKKPSSFFTQAWFAHLLTFVSVGLLSLFAFFTQTLGDDGFKEILPAFIVFIGFIYTLSSVGALFSKVHLKRYQFSRFLLIANFLFISLVSYFFIEDTLAFNIRNSTLLSVIDVVIKIAIILLALISAFKVIFPERDAKKVVAWVSSGVVVGFLLLFGISQIADDDSSQYDIYGSLGVPFFNVQKSAKSIDALNEKLDLSVKTIQEYRKKSLDEEEKNETKSD